MNIDLLIEVIDLMAKLDKKIEVDTEYLNELKTQGFSQKVTRYVDYDKGFVQQDLNEKLLKKTQDLVGGMQTVTVDVNFNKANEENKESEDNDQKDKD